jgi:predicted CXXCH cytochrome family protein
MRQILIPQLFAKVPKLVVIAAAVALLIVNTPQQPTLEAQTTKIAIFNSPHPILGPQITEIAIFNSPHQPILGAQITEIAISKQQAAKTDQKAIDPAAWGGNHVGKQIPEYVHGDECLFCHRNTIGVTWQKNAHGVSVRQKEDAPEFESLVQKQPAFAIVADQIEYFLGSRHHVRFMKKAGYGKFALLNTQAVLGPTGTVAKWIDLDNLSWDKERFANRCAGCHATGIDVTAKTFAGFGIDCYACHGDATLDHTKDTSLLWLSKKRRDDARVITSICSQCHVRVGKSRSTGLPYPNTFIAGDNLFQDFEVDFAKADDETLNPGDRHILQNIRDVVVRGEQTITCLTCHDLHGNSAAKHLGATRGPICANCHGVKFVAEVKPFAVHSALCEY